MPKTAAAKLKSTEKVIDIKVLVEFFYYAHCGSLFYSQARCDFVLGRQRYGGPNDWKIEPAKGLFPRKAQSARQHGAGHEIARVSKASRRRDEVQVVIIS